MSIANIKIIYRDLFYNYCFSCKACQKYKIHHNLYSFPSQLQRIHFHADNCCPENKEEKEHFAKKLEIVDENIKKLNSNREINKITIPYDHIFKLYIKLHYKYCFNCSFCQTHNIKLLCYGRAPLSIEESIKYHAEFAVKERKN